MKHTPEPWKVNKMHVSADISHIGSCYGTMTSKEEDRANAARIVACVNACAGMESPEDDIKRYKKALSSCLYYLQKIANMPEYRQDEIDYLAARGVLELERALPDIFPDL